MNAKSIRYIATVLVAAWLWMLSIKLGFRPGEWVWVTVLMWIPGLTSILFRLVFREGFADVGWRIGKTRFWAWAYLGPLGLASLSVLVALLLGKVTVGDGAWFLIGDYGVLTLVSYGALVAWLYWSGRVHPVLARSTAR